MATMNGAAIAAMNENFANVVESIAKGESYAKTVDGALGIITKYWNKGYGDAAKALGLGIDKPKALRAYIMTLLKGEGLHEKMYTANKKGESVVGVWSQKCLQNTTVPAVIDARGNETYPLVKDETGKNVHVDVCKPITSFTPKTIFTLILQNEAMKAGAVPFTENDGLQQYVMFATAPAVESVPAPKNQPKNKKAAKAA